MPERIKKRFMLATSPEFTKQLAINISVIALYKISSTLNFSKAQGDFDSQRLHL
jgi:hypothetical protein